MQKIKVLLNGASGKMGKAIVPVLTENKDIELVAMTDINDDLTAVLESVDVDVGVDFTQPSAVMSNTLCFIRHGVRPVVGTTGLTDSQVDELKNLCQEKKLGGIVAPNFCIGAVLMMQFAAVAGKHFEKCEIIEGHHDKKLDAPSGTSLRTARLIAEAGSSKSDDSSDPLADGDTDTGKFRCGNQYGIRIHSVRLPGLLAHQRILFGNPGEILSIHHDVSDRTSFIPGIMFAIREVMNLNQLVLGLEHILKH